MTNGCSVVDSSPCLPDSVTSVDFSETLPSVSSEEPEPAVGDIVTAASEATSLGEIDDGIKVSGVSPELSSSVKEETELSCSVMMTNGCSVVDSSPCLPDSVTSVDFPVALVSVSFEEPEPTVEDTVTAGIEVTEMGKIDDGIKVSGVSPELSSSVKEETELSCSLMMTNGCSVLDDSTA
ncbi:hypothetical protein AALO_G00063660, partial [Alosa alosa]